MRTSAVIHPPDNQFIIIRSWQIAFCEGNDCAAAVLSFFEYCHNLKLAEQKQVAQENVARIEENLKPKPIPDLYHYHSYDELVSRLMIYSKKTIRLAIRLLVSKGAINIRNNPSPSFKFDHTLQYLLYPDILNSYINSIGEFSPVDRGKIGSLLEVATDDGTKTYGGQLKEAGEISPNNTNDVKRKEKTVAPPPNGEKRSNAVAPVAAGRDYGAEAKRFLGGYCAAFTKFHRDTFMPTWGRDMKILKDLLAVFSYAELERRANFYLCDTDPFVKKNGFSIPIFRSRINAYTKQIRAENEEPRRPSHRPIVIPPGEDV